MDKGIQPYLPKQYCNQEGYISDYSNKDNWSLQWGLDQNSIAVLYKDNIVAIMPEWAGTNDFYGYSIGTNSETPVAWPLIKDNAQLERFQKEKEFLDSWVESKWVNYQENTLSSYDALYEGETRYFAADGGKWPPLGIHYCKTSELEFIATVGMAILPMPTLRMQHNQKDDYTHIELAIIYRNANDFEALAHYLSGQATYPWCFGNHFDHGHTLPCEQLREVGSEATHMAIVEKASFLSNIAIPSFEGYKTRLLFMVPIHASEQQYAESNSTAELIKKLEKCSDPFDIKRQSII